MPGVVYPPAPALARYLREGVLTTECLIDVLRQSFRQHADRTALIAADGRLTYRALDDLSDRLGAALLRLGLAPRDRVLFQFVNVAEVCVAFYACLKAGLIPICTIANHREAEIGYLADFCDVRAHFVQGDLPRVDLVDFALRMQAAHPSIRHVVVGRGASRACTKLMADLIDDMDPAAARRALAAVEHDPFDVVLFQLSGGTTGTPKVIPRFNNEYLYNARALVATSGYDRDSVTLWPLPFMHNAAMVVYTLPTHLVGGALVLLRDLSPGSILGTIERERVSRAGMGQPLLIRIADSGLRPKHDLGALRSCISSARIALVESVLGCPGFPLFGMAEGMIVRAREGDPDELRRTTLGYPVSPFDEVKILAPGTEDEVADGAVGEFCARGPYTIHGYYRAPEHDAKAFTADGFYRSGDLMRAVVADGRRYLAFVGRIKDNINRGGEKIHSDEVERALARHPAIRDVAVIGMPDREFGERVCAYIVIEDRAAPPGLGDIAEHLRTLGLAKFKWPERVEIVDNFPVTAVGKPSKALLREDIRRKLSAEGAEFDDIDKKQSSL
jgi:2,3-dihydroxybenzoate-AMP ligase